MARKSTKKSKLEKWSQITNYEQSRFWQRLEALEQDETYAGDKTKLRTLKANVAQVVEHSDFILRQICRFLPQYTLHDQTHILNVLCLMDNLTPDAVMDKLEPLECALCILAAYTHDLGMALQDEEYRALKDELGEENRRRLPFLRFRDGYAEEVRQLERLEKSEAAGDKTRAEHIEAHILAEYIRKTHSEGDVDRSRINQWLEAMKAKGVANNASLFDAGVDYQQWLVLISASHAYDATWLRNQFATEEAPRAFQVLIGNSLINLAFPGLLLRLADIMDFDASRTPRILFKHAGIENKVSLQEWRKHLAITGWALETLPNNEPQLTYAALQCDHPVYEKSIRDFVGWIEAEIRAVRGELDWQRRVLADRGQRYDIHLPRGVHLDIHPKGWPQNPCYTYHDLQFQLDQDEIQQLLMGETLYGDPGLCIRELLQNALDALELRDLRLRMSERGETLSKPVDPLPVVNGTREELQVRLSWGRDKESDQEFIRVSDNGTGMTERIITEYFTQVGKSFYRSPEYSQEKATLKAGGIATSPISIFGIGILSCFMIGDRLRVRTRPGGANDGDRAAYDVTISGPGSLFWMQPGTLERQGTEITLYLKPRFHIAHDPDRWIPGLKKHFEYPNGEKYKIESGVIDPAFIAARHVVWPRYPIVIERPDQPPIRLDDRFHVEVLAPIDPEAVRKKAAEWDFGPSSIGDPEWGIWDWEDRDATGSRIRLWFPRNHRDEEHPDLPVDPPEGSGLCRQPELSAFVEPQLEEALRATVLVRGMSVGDTSVALRQLAIAPSVGSRLWVDLRGDAAPRLTADRKTMLVPESTECWNQDIQSFYDRLGDVLPGGNVKSLFKTNLIKHTKESVFVKDNLFIYRENIILKYAMILQDFALDLDLDRDRDR